MLFRQQTIHATAHNSTMNMTEVPCYRTTTITTTLVLDSLSIYPTVEGCGVPGSFYQNFSPLVTINSIRLVLRYDDLLEFRFVEHAVQFSTVPIDQAIYGWIGSVCVNNRKQLFCPVRHAYFFEVSFRFAYAFPIADSELWSAAAFVTIQSLPHGFLIGAVHF